MWRLSLLALLIGVAGPAWAHVSEQGLVLLLPTGLYIAGGVATVAVTFLLLWIVPDRLVHRLFRPVMRWRVRGQRAAAVTRALSTLALVALIVAGFVGDHDPLENPLPLVIWTVVWIGVVSVQGVVFDLWRWINPLQPLALFRGVLRYPAWAGRWPAVLLFLCFAGFFLADPAPADPDHLARVILAYVSGTLAALFIFGPRWLVRGEFLTVLMRTYRRTAVLGGAWGVPGWKLVATAIPTLSMAIFMLSLLAVGSFDGLNETFWWLAILGVNPLEFPGRSAIVGETLIGLAVFLAGLVAVYAVVILLGQRLAGNRVPFWQSFRAFAPGVLPIAVGYHVAHYLTSFLVDIQYVASAVSRIFTGQEIPVTTGFFNTVAAVRLIWLTQAGAVVIGHVVAILVAHAIGLRLYGDRKGATVSQVPLAVLMVAYTLFGLWLLASPRGV